MLISLSVTVKSYSLTVFFCKLKERKYKIAFLLNTWNLLQISKSGYQKLLMKPLAKKINMSLLLEAVKRKSV